MVTSSALSQNQLTADAIASTGREPPGDFVRWLADRPGFTYAVDELSGDQIVAAQRGAGGGGRGSEFDRFLPRGTPPAAPTAGGVFSR